MRKPRLDQSTLLELIGLAYAAAEDAAQWQAFLVGLADALAATSAVLMYHDLVGRGSVVAQVRLDPESVRLYDEHYRRFDPWATSLRSPRLAVPGLAVREETILPHADLRRTEFSASSPTTSTCPDWSREPPDRVALASIYNITPAPRTGPSRVVRFDQRDFLNAMHALDAVCRGELQRQDGLSIGGRPDFLGIASWIGGAPDFLGIATWIFDIYLNGRVAGGSSEHSWATVIGAIRASDEYRSKH